MMLAQPKSQMLADSKNHMVYLNDFVQEFRRAPNLEMLREPFEQTHPKLDALLASTAETLCAEADLTQPQWIYDVPPTKYPYFVAELENLKAIALVESPMRFRKRNVFVLKNFLNRI